MKRNVSASSMMLLLSPILMRWSTHLASEQVIPQSVFEVGAFPTFIQCSCVITSVYNHISKNDNMRLSFKCSIVPQSVLVVCIFSPFNYIHLCIPHRSRALFQKMMIGKCLSGTFLFLHCRQDSTKAWAILEWHCPQYDPSVLVHWLSVFEHHCL